MTLDRRKRLVELAKQYNVIVLEDDAYGGIDFEDGAAALKEMDNGGLLFI